VTYLYLPSVRDRYRCVRLDLVMSYLYHCGVSRRAPWVNVTTHEGSGWIRTGPSTAIPSVFLATVDDPAQPFICNLEVRTRAGRRPEVVRLDLEIRNLADPGGISTEGLRQVQVAKALTLALTKATQRVSDEGDGLFRLPGDPTGTSWGGDHVARPVRGAPVTEEFLQLVAHTYRSAVASGSRSPVGDLGRELGGSRSTAGRWVVQARKAGFLRPAIGRTSGEVAPTVRAKKGKNQ
jgi:hypothetical protein